MKRRTTARTNEHGFRERSTLAETAKRPKNVRASIPAILSGQQVRPAHVYHRRKAVCRRRAGGASAMRLTPCFSLLFPIALGVIAILYSAVGQAGGTGYVALMGLVGFAPAIIKPTALSLNLLVSAIGLRPFLSFGSAHMANRLPICRSRLAVLTARGRATSPANSLSTSGERVASDRRFTDGAHRPGDQGAGRRRAVGPAVYQVALPRRDY